MAHIHILLTIVFISLFNLRSNGGFVPDRNDYNAYGLKIAMNEILFVEVHNVENFPTFLVQFGPFNLTDRPLQCKIHLNELTNHYIYTVAISEVDSEIFFAGELIGDQMGTFVGVIKMNDTNLMTNMDENQCNCSYSYSINHTREYEHQEHYTIGVQPSGRYAYGFSNKFLFIFNSKNDSSLEYWNGTLTWLNNSFMPHAVHLTENFGVIAGFTANAPCERKKYLPMIYLLNFNSSNYPIIVDYFQPNTIPHTWEDVLTNSDAHLYSAKYDMSVSINKNGSILVGMPHINQAFLLSVNSSNPKNLRYKSRFTNGRCLGYGKSVAWLDHGNMAAVLVNTYSLDYDWQSSQIHIYDMTSGIYNSNSTPLSIFPNYHQKLPKKWNPVFLKIISSGTSLALLIDHGDVIIFVPTRPGTFPSITSEESCLPGTFPSIGNKGSMSLITSEKSCLPGTYKDRSGIHDCILCPMNTKNPGNSNTQCISCSNSSFCPLGSSNETCTSELNQSISSFSYPRSSEITSFDGVLFANIFGITPNGCTFPRSMFYTLIIGIGSSLFFIFIMAIFKYCFTRPRIRSIRAIMKKLLQGIDFFNEGKSWFGGALSLTFAVLVICTSIFADQFYRSYPIENRTDSYFACDSHLVNAVFESSEKLLGLPQRNQEKIVLDLLDDQYLTLNVSFVNTLIDCDAVELGVLFGNTWLTHSWTHCENINSTLSISMPLPHQDTTVKILLSDPKTIGGLHIGLYGGGFTNESYTLQQLYFHKSFYKNGYVLGRNIPLSITITKVINETVSIEDESSVFSGIFIPTCEADYNNILLSNKQYIYSTSSDISLQISLRESLYYEKNLQEPMATRSQVIFQVILFIFVCRELLQLVFTVCMYISRLLLHFVNKNSRCCRRRMSTQNLAVTAPRDSQKSRCCRRRMSTQNLAVPAPRDSQKSHCCRRRMSTQNLAVPPPRDSQMSHCCRRRMSTQNLAVTASRDSQKESSSVISTKF